MSPGRKLLQRALPVVVSAAALTWVLRSIDLGVHDLTGQVLTRLAQLLLVHALGVRKHLHDRLPVRALG